MSGRYVCRVECTGLNGETKRIDVQVPSMRIRNRDAKTMLLKELGWSRRRRSAGSTHGSKSHVIRQERVVVVIDILSIGNSLASMRGGHAIDLRVENISDGPV
jgi:hypothetical protein